MDDPLWDKDEAQTILKELVLIPLLVDDPLWEMNKLSNNDKFGLVLIPLLVDDPLWVGFRLVYTL